MTAVLTRTTATRADRTTGPRSRRRRTVMIVGALLGLCVAVAAAAFYLGGGRNFVVRTPSMGTTAPVGTLVLTEQVDFASVRVGDVIAFHPPTERDEVYTHRVVAKSAAGLRTQGDINGAVDPWTVSSRDLIGRATVVLPAVGWLVRALPFLIIGGLIVWGLTRSFVSAARRGPVRQFGAAVVFLVTAIVLRPFVGVAQLASVSNPDGTSRISAVSTGLLPVRLVPADGSGSATPVDLDTAGATGTTVLRGGVPGHQYQLNAELHLYWWQWVLAIAVVLSPLLWTLIVGFRPVPITRRGVSHRAATA